MIVVSVTILALLALAATFTALFSGLFRQTSGAAPGGERWLDEFSLDKYGPLERLFDPADLRFVAAHPAYSASLGKKLATSRRAATRLYLSELTADFDRLFRIGREMLAASPVSRPDLSSALFRQSLAFHAQVIALRLRLRLAPLGLAPARPTGLLEALGRMRGLVAVMEAPAKA
jgi:hypothetical protein